MKDEQFNHIEDRMREAIHATQTAFEEASWERMALLLDKEKKKRFPVWWFILPLALGLATIIYWTTEFKSQRATAIENSRTANSKVSRDKTRKGQGSPAELAYDIPGQSPDTDKLNTADNKVRPIKVHDANPLKRFHQPVTMSAESDVRLDAKKDERHPTTTVRHSKIHETVLRKSNPVLVETTSHELKQPGTVEDKENPDNSSVNYTPVGTPRITLDFTNVPTKKVSVAKPDKKANSRFDDKHSRQPGFNFTTSVGIDNSNVKPLSNKNSQPALQYGLGVGYDISRKIAIQAAILVSHKKYVAGPRDYTAKAGSYLSMVAIRRVDANCLVYEIPLSIKYNAYRSTGFDIFAASGLSSYIMKREDYRYEYLRNYAVNYTNWTYRGNQHLFSVLNFSAGIEKKGRKGFSILAAPVISIPLKGVGEGKVKLYSTALQLSLKYTLLREARHAIDFK